MTAKVQKKKNIKTHVFDFLDETLRFFRFISFLQRSMICLILKIDPHLTKRSNGRLHYWMADLRQKAKRAGSNVSVLLHYSLPI